MITNWRPLRRALCTAVLGIAALWALPNNARAQLYVGQRMTGIVSKFDATTGIVINTDFIDNNAPPYGLALSGNHLFVTSLRGVVEYNAATGTPIDFIVTPQQTSTAIAVSGNQLFVAGDVGTASGSGTVGEYDASTGATINAFFITGLNRFYYGLALSGNTLFVANLDGGGGRVGAYDAATGAPINADFITGLNDPVGLALSGNHLFVANFAGSTVGEYDASTGAAINARFISGLSEPFGLALSDNTLFVSNRLTNTVGAYDATTGAPINADFITGLNDPVGLLVAPVPEPSPWSMIAAGGVALLAIMLRKKHGIA